MYAITGVTGKVGGALADALLAAGLPVRAVVRDVGRAQAWADRGCEIALAGLDDSVALAAAFQGAAGVFILPPPEFDPAPGFPEARAVISAVRTALEIAQPAEVVCLSTIGAQANQVNLLTQRTLMEQALGELTIPMAFLRPAWFMENALWDVPTARDTGVIQSFLQPLDKPVPMIGTADIGRVAAQLLQENWRGMRMVEVEGPTRYSPNDLAQAFAKIIGHPVRAEAVPRQTWEGLFRAQGMRNPLPRIQMLDGFNQGWIAFAGDPTSVLKGQVGLETVIQELVQRA